MGWTRRFRMRFSLMTALVVMSSAAIGIASVVYWQTPRLKRDVRMRVDEDFPAEQRRDVSRVLLSYDGSEMARVRRCILHLANGNIEGLKRAAADASMDYRNVILRAEYATNVRGWHDDRVRDYNVPFGESNDLPIDL